MKKLLAFLTAAAMLSAVLADSAAAAASIKRVSKPQIQVLLDGKKMSFADAKPFSDSSKRVLVPIRFVSEALGAKVDWNSAKSTVNISMNKKEVTLVLGQSSAKVNGVTMKFDTQAVSSHSRIFVPLRFVSEALGQTVNWDSQGSWVWIGKQEVPKIEDVSELKDLGEYKKYFSGDYGRSLISYGKDSKFKSIRIISAAQLPVKILDHTIYDIWTVSDGDNIGLQIRYKGPDLDMFFISSKFEPKQRSGYIKKISEGFKIATYELKHPGDGLFHGDNNWRTLSLKSIDYFCFRSYIGEDSVHLLFNPFK
ncbi:copper amine oxidase N-terminal domain-containing protein [Paenibacillus sp. CAA11]|uniref:copper amine oxidase N-terminal domain-containing protein n=1 Tax=Paenibacillus sp. CAA11 TaxID=1532905 RepID=UPI00131F2A3B|nr:copper amine oxidase N-terminal domain-containing protein [Paenibacillus sp. CAA11]